MMMCNVALRLVAALTVLTGLAFAGGAMAAAPDRPAAPEVKAAETVAVEKSDAACARKIKVVYAGYGEADRACAPTAKVADR